MMPQNFCKVCLTTKTILLFQASSQFRLHQMQMHLSLASYRIMIANLLALALLSLLLIAHSA